MVNKTAMTAALRSVFTAPQGEALVSLFKLAPPVPNASSKGTVSGVEAMKMGLLFVSENCALAEDIPVDIYAASLKEYGIDARMWNQTFYKSFADVRDVNPARLVFDQILHYFTTYGAEALGIELPTYIPAATLEVPDMVPDSKYKFTVITLATEETCIERINKYFANLAAPPASKRDMIMTLLPATTLDTDDIRSFELQVVQHKRLGTVPKQPVNQLRFIVHLITGDTMLIKNRYMRERIQSYATASGGMALELFQKCNMQGLASIFLRYKPIFLAFKKHNGCAPFMNQLRRMAEQYHRPLPMTALQNFTQIDDPELQAEIIMKATNRDLVKLLNSINTRVLAGRGAKAVPAVYQVRNGRTFVRESAVVASPRMEQIGKMIYSTLVERITPAVKGKVFYIPQGIQYAIPTTEKQFVGNIPYGSRIIGLPKGAFTAGIHWVNQGGRTDIDLHMNSATEHFGWNSRYRKGGDILYTGDLTDAPEPHGAAEAYWFTLGDEPFILTANLYSGAPNSEFKFCLTETKPDGRYSDRFSHQNTQNQRYTMDMNNLLFTPIKLNFINENALTLGMFAQNAFYFYGGTLSNGIVPSANYEQFIEGLTTKLNAQMILNFLLEHAGAIVISELPTASDNPEDYASQEDYENFMKEHNAILASIISLAPEDLAIDTLVNIIDGNG